MKLEQYQKLMDKAHEISEALSELPPDKIKEFETLIAERRNVKTPTTASEVNLLLNRLEKNELELEKSCYFGSKVTWAHEEGDIRIPGAEFYLTMEEVEGGYEGAGEDFWAVFAVRDASSGAALSYWRMDGCYYSYDGAYLDGAAYEVEPKKVEVTQWFDRKG